MGKGLINEDLLKVEHSFMFLVIAGIVIHFISKYSVVSLDTTAFVIFSAMCLAGYLALKTAQDLIVYVQERKAAYETLKSNIYVSVTPVAFSNNTKFSKYATSISAKKL